MSGNNCGNCGNSITVSGCGCGSVIEITQPITNVVEVLTGPMGPKGDNGPSGTALPFSYAGGDLYSTTSSIQVGGNIFGTASWASQSISASYAPPSDVIQTDGISARVATSPTSLFVIQSSSADLLRLDDTSLFAFSGSVEIHSTNTSSIFLITKVDGINADKKVEINNEGVFVLGTFNQTPTPVAGGIFFSSSNDFFLGF